MAIVALIGGTLAAGSGLLALMTWLETSLQRSLAPDEAPEPEPEPLPSSPDAEAAPQPMRIAA